MPADAARGVVDPVCGSPIAAESLARVGRGFTDAGGSAGLRRSARGPAAGRDVLGLLIEDRRPRFGGVVHAGRVRCWAPAVSGVLREGRDRRRPHRGGITGQVCCPSRRLDCSDLRRTCSTETPPEPARSRRPSDIPTVLVSIHRFAGRGGSRLLASYHSGMLTVGLISRMALAWPGVEPRDAIPIGKSGQRQTRGGRTGVVLRSR